MDAILRQPLRSFQILQTRLDYTPAAESFVPQHNFTQPNHVRIAALRFDRQIGNSLTRIDLFQILVAELRLVIAKFGLKRIKQSTRSNLDQSNDELQAIQLS